MRRFDAEEARPVAHRSPYTNSAATNATAITTNHPATDSALTRDAVARARIGWAMHATDAALLAALTLAAIVCVVRAIVLTWRG